MFEGPKEFAQAVHEKWPNLVGGDFYIVGEEYITPPCPPLKILTELFEVCWYTACLTEEQRYPKFNVLIRDKKLLTSEDSKENHVLFSDPIQLSVDELRRLVPTTDLKKSAVFCYWDSGKLWIAGIYDLGTSWSRARIGLSYSFKPPQGLLIEVDKPGHMQVFQGEYRVGELQNGKIIGFDGIDINLFFHDVVNLALDEMRSQIINPKIEHPKEFTGTEFLVLTNTLIALTAEISASGHGGMLIFLGAKKNVIPNLIKAKYKCDSDYLRNTFLNFINERHIFGDLIANSKSEKTVPQNQLNTLDLSLRDKHEALVEATRLISRFSGCDGAIIISSDMRILGFGAEIKAELQKGLRIEELDNDLNRNSTPCDIEQFGMRHRSALKLASCIQGCKIVAISQDGPATGVYRDGNRILLRKGIKLVNSNMPLG